MKRKTIERLLQENQIPAFDFENDAYSITWYIMLADEKIIGKRIVDENDGVNSEFYPQIPFRCKERCESLYALILCDLVDCYGEDLYLGATEGSALFSDFASPADAGLAQILKVFGKTYDQFLVDLFYWYGAFVEEYPFLCENKAPSPKKPDDVALTKAAREACAVLEAHDEDASRLTFLYDDDSAVRWRFVIDHDRLWYLRIGISYADGEDLQSSEEYGSFALNDSDHWGALRDIVLADCWRVGCEAKTEISDPFGLIGINPDDLEDEE